VAEARRDNKGPAEESAFAQLLEAAPDAMLGVDDAGEIVFANAQTEKLFGYPRSELLGRSIETLVPERLAAEHVENRAGYVADPRPRRMGTGDELHGRRRDGGEFPAEISLSRIETAAGPRVIAAVRDVTERVRSRRELALQGELERARRLESVGQLAGGIAHDFNNLLGVILNYAEFACEGLDPGSPARDDIEEVRKAAQRAAALTRQLLIFSRREVAKPEVLHLRDVVADLENLLGRALGERVELEMHFGADRVPIEIDAGQLEQVLVNLALNARDAMPEGGRLIVEVESVSLDAGYTELHPDIEPGSYARLKVSDTGIGMDRETVERVFEPFFTTKEEGTGLGLATVYGIVTGAGGRIDVYSEPGLGTTVKMHLPASEREPDAAVDAVDRRPRGRGERILIVEDDPGVRRMTERILSAGGYEVIETSDGAAAVAICASSEPPVDLLVSDVVMPGMLGTELVEKVRGERPGMRTLFMSGYSHEVLAAETLGGEAHSGFIEKPFSAAQLLEAIRAILDADGGGP
jgi:PAS domain S-box-containing protein